MNIFFELIVNLMPLYGLIAAGYFIGRFAHIDRETLINIVLYLCLPIVVFGFILNLDLKPAYALLPVIIFVIQSTIGLVTLSVSFSNTPRGRWLQASSDVKHRSGANHAARHSKTCARTVRQARRSNESGASQ